MSRQPHPALIGAFVVGAVVILVIGLILFGGRGLFVRTHPFALFFKGSVNGLTVGAPVRLRGVAIGQVTQIRAAYDDRNKELLIPVYIEVEEGRVEDLAGDNQAARRPKPVEDEVRELIAQGLRAELVLQSLLTGKLFIQFDFRPDTPVHLVGIKTGVTELPTVPSTTEEVARAVRKLVAELSTMPIDQIVTRLNSALAGIDELVHAPQLIQTLDALNTASGQLERFIARLDERVDPLADQLQATLTSAQGLMQDMDRQVRPLGNTLRSTLQDTRTLVNETRAQWIPLLRSTAGTLEQARITLSEFEGLAKGTNPLGYQLSQMLTSLGAAARSLRALTSYLERHPEALLKGKPGSRYR